MSNLYEIMEVEYNGEPRYAVRLQDIRFDGIMVVYDRVQLLPEGDHAVLSFDYDILRNISKDYKREDLEEHLGELLEELIRERLKTNSLVYSGGTDEQDRENNTIKLNTQRGLLSEGSSVSEE